MIKQIYQVEWLIRCCEFGLVKTEWKVFDSESEAESYGR